MRRIGTGDLAFAADHHRNAISLLTGPSSSGARCLGLMGSKSRSSPAARRCDRCEFDLLIAITLLLADMLQAPIPYRA
jgi:hypothetical protein